MDRNNRSPDAGPIVGALVRATYMDGDEVPVDVPMLTGRSYSSPDGG